MVRNYIIMGWLLGIMEKKMETTIILELYGGYMGTMEKKMETTIVS